MNPEMFRWQSYVYDFEVKTLFSNSIFDRIKVQVIDS